MCSVTWKSAVRLCLCGSSEVGSACKPTFSTPPFFGVPPAGALDGAAPAAVLGAALAAVLGRAEAAADGAALRAAEGAVLAPVEGALDATGAALAAALVAA